MKKDLILTDQDNLRNIILKLYLYITQNQKEFLKNDLFYKNIKIIYLFNSNMEQADCKKIEELLKLLCRSNADSISKCQSMINLLSLTLYEKDFFYGNSNDDICNCVRSTNFWFDITDNNLIKQKTVEKSTL